MAMKKHHSLTIWIELLALLTLTSGGLSFRIPIRADLLDDSSPSAVLTSIIKSTVTNTSANASSSSSTSSTSSSSASSSSSTTTTVASTVHSPISTQISSSTVTSSSSSTVIRDQRPTLEANPDQSAKEQLRPRSSESDRSAEELSVVEDAPKSEAIQLHFDDEEKQADSLESSTPQFRKIRKNMRGQRKKIRQMKQRGNRRTKTINLVETSTQPDDTDDLGDTGSELASTVTKPSSHSRRRKKRGIMNKSKESTDLKPRHRRRIRNLELQEPERDDQETEEREMHGRPEGRERPEERRAARRKKAMKTETVTTTTEIPKVSLRKREVKKKRTDQKRSVEETRQSDESQNAEETSDEDYDYEEEDHDDYDGDYDEYDEKENKQTSPSSKVRRTGAPEVTSAPTNYIGEDEDDEDLEDYAEYDDDDEANDEVEDSEDDETNEDSASSKETNRNEGRGGDVTPRSTNEEAAFSDSQQQSADVTTGSTNGGVASMITGSDVGHQGVGGKSMNEFLAARLRTTRPARLTALADCGLDDLRLVVQCGDRVMSVCAATPHHPRLKVLLENGDGGARLNSNATAAYVHLRPSSSGGRWMLTDSPTQSALNSAQEPGPTDIPVLRLQAGKHMCLVQANCTRTTSSSEAWHPLPSNTHLPSCSRPPSLHVRLLVTTLNDSEILTGTKISLGEKIMLRVEAEADLTGSSLGWADSGAVQPATPSEDETKALRPLLDLHLARCWVGNREVDKATLVKDGCSTVDILTNFVEKTENTTTFSNFIPIATTTYNRSRGHLLNKSSQESSTTNSPSKESGFAGRRTALTHRIVQKAELVTFVMDLSDRIVDISCSIEICIGQCRTAPSCVNSSVNTAHPLPPAHSTTITLTTSFTPDTGTEDIGVTPEPSTTEQLPTTGVSVTASPVTEADKLSLSRQARYVDDDDNLSTTQTNATHANLNATRPSEARASRPEMPGTRERSPPFSECIPWWLFLLCITILSIVYIIALIGCVYMSSHNEPVYSAVDFQGTVTPVRSQYPDQSSARKRTPQTLPERYMY